MVNSKGKQAKAKKGKHKLLPGSSFSASNQASGPAVDQRIPRSVENQEVVLRQQIETLKAQLEELKQKNRKEEVKCQIRGILEGTVNVRDLSIQDLRHLDPAILDRLGEVLNRIAVLEKQVPDESQSDLSLELKL